MTKDGDLIKLRESQIVALQLQKEIIDGAVKAFNMRMDFLKQGMSDLVILIGKELEIPVEEASNWHMTQKFDAFEYKAPEEK